MPSKRESKPFQFQQFSVDQRDCGMKITEDAVCFGAWINLSACKHILDLGTGTGLLSLMLAQRYGDVQFTAVEIDPLAAKRAQRNFESSPWSDLMAVICGNALHGDFIQQQLNEIWSQRGSRMTKVDAMVCNPPFFHRGTAASGERRQLAREDSHLPYEDLWKKAIAIAQPLKVFLIIPSDRKVEMDALAQKHNYWPHRATMLSGVEGKPAHCALLEYGRSENLEPEVTVLFVRNKSGAYHSRYLNLVKGFYLKR